MFVDVGRMRRLTVQSQHRTPVTPAPQNQATVTDDETVTASGSVRAVVAIIIIIIVIISSSSSRGVVTIPHHRHHRVVIVTSAVAVALTTAPASVATERYRLPSLSSSSSWPSGQSSYVHTDTSTSPSPGFRLRVVCHSYKLHPHEWSVRGHLYKHITQRVSVDNLSSEIEWSKCLAKNNNIVPRR